MNPMHLQHGDMPWGFVKNLAGTAEPILHMKRFGKTKYCSLNKPDKDDNEDPDRLTQTALEQSAANAKFREIGKFFRNVTYLHLAP